MMGSTLGSTVEGSSAAVIENKPTHSSTPFMTVFDEVGYYVAEGMAVMAAQARSLGFSLVFAGQDLPALKKRVREEANSITANCNIKLFGKLEDPTETKDFFEKTVGSAMVTEVSGFQMTGGSELGNYYDSRQAGVQLRPRANYDELRGYKEGQAIITYGDQVFDCSVFYSNPGFAKAMRVTRFMALPAPDDNILKHASAITKLRDLMVNKTWSAERADVAVETLPEIAALKEGFTKNNRPNVNPVEAGITALVEVHALTDNIPPPSDTASATKTPEAAQPAAATPVQTPAQPQKQSSGAAPSVFGGARTAAPTQPKIPEAPAQSAKPAQPKEPVSPEEQKLIDAAQDVQRSVFEGQSDEDKLIKAAQSVKKNLFGQNPDSETKPAEEAKPMEKTRPAEETKPIEAAQKTDVVSKKPAIFGGGTASSDKKDDK
jgi:intracellular multiplication protein IcmO